MPMWVIRTKKLNHHMHTIGLAKEILLLVKLDACQFQPGNRFKTGMRTLQLDLLVSDTRHKIYVEKFWSRKILRAIET